MLRSRLAIVAITLAAPSSAGAIEWLVRIEPGVAFPVGAPQSRLLGVGGHLSLKAGIAPLRFLDLSLSGQFVGLPAMTSNPDQRLGQAWSLGVNARLRWPRKSTGFLSPWIDFEPSFTRSGDNNRFAFSIGAGISIPGGDTRRFWFGPFVRYFQIATFERAGFDFTDAKTILAGFAFEVGPPISGETRPAMGDRDGDGILDADDKCPEQPEDRDGFEDNDGCPDGDNDQDGIADGADKCPNQAEDKDGFQDEDGCPDPDDDGDGIIDANDKCPKEPEDRDGFEDDDGCPEADNDKDGVVDSDDKCPNVAGPKESWGCPDRDGDGTDDQHDQCPDVPGPLEQKGCPVYKAVKVTKDKLEISQKIFFAFDKSKILPKSFPLLEEVAKVLKDYPALKVRVEGHTDSQGKLKHNMELSQGRANSVRDFLIKKGVKADRLEAKGFGPEHPIDNNATVEGREHNRRVEFVITAGGGEK
jgi:outer membrane protein OmpA-like peptidoglycan-associated protein